MAGRTPQARLDDLAFAVARGLSVRAAGRTLGINHKTSQNYTCRPEYKTALAGYLAERRKRNAALLTSAAALAVRQLMKLVNSSDEDVSLKACDVILRHGESYTLGTAAVEGIAAVHALAVESHTERRVRI